MESLMSIWQSVAKRLLILCLLSVLSVGGVFTLTGQAVNAQTLFNDADGFQTKEELTNQDPSISGTEPSYDTLAEEAKNPRVLQTERYQEDLKNYKESNPDKGVVEKAKELVTDVTR